MTEQPVEPYTRGDFIDWLKVTEPDKPYENPMPGQILQIVSFRTSYDGEREKHLRITTDLAQATSISSQTTRDLSLHKPILDIDLSVKVVESSTPGHHHLYIDKEMSWDDYELLLRALTVVGILEPGYLQASIDRKHTSVRLPWVRKDVVG